MRWLLDAAYVIGAVISCPVWLWRMGRTGKLQTDWAARFGHAAIPPKSRPRIMLHAVSVGEINAIRLLVEELIRRRPDVEVVVTATTDTGVARARELYSRRCVLGRYPFDVSWAVERFLRAVEPDVVGLVELEVWPNFTAACMRRSIPVVVVNGRLSERSSRRYGHIALLVRSMFRRLSHAAMQTQIYADRIMQLGVPRDRISVSGTMKWDTAEIADVVEGADAFAAELGIDRGRPLVVAGSTAPEEHALIRDAVGDGVQLLCAPRKPEWFDDAAEVLQGCARRSKGDRGSSTGRYLLDTIGELRKAYALADVVVVGRTFVDLHGSDMIEPVALGKPVIAGPDTKNFEDSMQALLAARGIVQTDRSGLRDAIRGLLENRSEAAAMVSRGREVIRSRQGATARTAELLIGVLETRLQAARSESSAAARRNAARA